MTSNYSADVIIIGGGLSGLAAAAALGGAGFSVRLFESRPFLGGRASSYEVGTAETIDNCQHVLLRCCHNLLNFYERLGVRDRIAFYREFYFLEPGGRRSVFRAGHFKSPAHFTGSFLTLSFLNPLEKFAVARAMLALKHQAAVRQDLDRISMQQWLQEQRQPPRAIERFWRHILVSAINEELPQMAAAHGFQVFRLGFLQDPMAYEMGVPAVPLGELYNSRAWERVGNVQINLRSPVQRVLFGYRQVESIEALGEPQRARAYVSSLPFERAGAMLPQLNLDLSAFEHSPITGIHLWFDRPVTDLPHATLLDRTIQWMFNKSQGRYIQLVVSASRSLTPLSRAAVIDLGVKELAEFFPLVKEAKLLEAHVVKEIKATFSAKPNLEALRPVNQTAIPNLFLAGDWTRSGWPATMEGAVRSGYLAAEAVANSLGRPQRFLIPDA